MTQETSPRPTGRALAERYAEDLTEKFAGWPGRPVFTVAPRGRKYLRVVQQDTGWDHRSQRFVHCFVDAATGALLKDAGWDGPAAGERGDLSTEEGYAAALNHADPYGSYLYRR